MSIEPIPAAIALVVTVSLYLEAYRPWRRGYARRNTASKESTSC